MITHRQGPLQHAIGVRVLDCLGTGRGILQRASLYVMPVLYGMSFHSIACSATTIYTCNACTANIANVAGKPERDLESCHIEQWCT